MVTLLVLDDVVEPVAGRRIEEVSCLIKGSTVIDPPWPEDAWERASEKRAQGKIKRFNMFDTWVQAAPAILDFLRTPAGRR